MHPSHPSPCTPPTPPPPPARPPPLLRKQAFQRVHHKNQKNVILLQRRAKHLLHKHSAVGPLAPDGQSIVLAEVAAAAACQLHVTQECHHSYSQAVAAPPYHGHPRPVPSSSPPPPHPTPPPLHPPTPVFLHTYIGAWCSDGDSTGGVISCLVISIQTPIPPLPPSPSPSLSLSLFFSTTPLPPRSPSQPPCPFLFNSPPSRPPLLPYGGGGCCSS